MKIKQLRKLLEALPKEYDNAPVYYSTCFTFSDDHVKENFDPEALTDIDEVSVDVSDNVIVLRGQP